MNLIDKIVENIKLNFTWKSKGKKSVKIQGGETQVYQEGGVTTILKIENFTINSIQRLASMSGQEDPDALIKSASQRFIVEQNIKQKNFKASVDKAELNKIKKPNEPEKDWFLRWVEISQGVSRENVQNILARILSGEVEKPNSFSLKTLDILKNLSKEELEVFQKFCDISFNIFLVGDMHACVICEPFGSPGDNGLSSFGLPYINLTLLQDAGLIKGDLNSRKEFSVPEFFRIPFSIGSEIYRFKETVDTKTLKQYFNTLMFTTAGLELRRVLVLGSNEAYDNKFIEWVKNSFKMELIK